MAVNKQVPAQSWNLSGRTAARWMAIWWLYLFAPTAEAAKVYWSDSQGIHRADLDGNAEELIFSDQFAHSVQIDSETGYIFWSNYDSGMVFRASLDGSGAIPIVSRPDTPPSTLAETAGSLYWLQEKTRTVERSAADGSNAETVVQQVGDPQFMLGLAVDQKNEALYWSENDVVGGGEIWKADLMGNGPLRIFNSDVISPSRLAVDPGGGWLYWSSNGDDQGLGRMIARSRLDGSEMEPLIHDVTANGLAIDTITDKLFWTRQGTIFSANLDGTEAGPLFATPGTGTYAIAIDNSVPGDANSDHLVNLEDFSILKANFGFGNRRSQGDLNGDQAIDLTDFGILKDNFGGTPAAAPEPTSLALASVALAWLLLRGRGRRRSKRRDCRSKRCGAHPWSDSQPRSRSSGLMAE